MSLGSRWFEVLVGNDYRKCSVVGCGREHSRNGYCNMHYLRVRTNGDPGPAHSTQPYRDVKLCSVSGCPRNAIAKNLCKMHYLRKRKNQDVGPSNRLTARRGEGSNQSGYIVFQKNKVRFSEHRVVMENVLGRKLSPDEKVHHRNGIRCDNRPENLELWVKSHPPGQRVEDLVEYVVTHYEDLVVAALMDKGLYI